MGVYKCQECSHETISADRPAECDICGSIDFMLLGEKKTKLETPDSISKNFTTPAPVSSPSSSSRLRKSTPAPVSSSSSSSRLRKSTPAPVSSPFSSSPPRKSTITRIAEISYNLTLRPLAQVLTWVYRQPGMLATGAVLMMGLAVYSSWQSRFDTSAFNKTVLNENFTSHNNNWRLTEGAVIKDGGLFQLQPKINYYGASIWTRQSFTDVDFSADVIKVNGPNDVSFGIIARLIVRNKPEFYYLEINGNGYFVMGKHSQGKWHNKIGWKKSNLIKRGNNKNNPNRLRLVCKGNLIMGFINNEMVGSFSDNQLSSSGKVAVKSERGKGNAVAVYFDNIIIKEKD